MTRISEQLLFVLVYSAFSCCVGNALALPPLGLTQIQGNPNPFSDLVVIEGVGYVSTTGGIYAIDSNGVGSIMVPGDPGFGSLRDTSRVVQSPAGDIFLAASFDGSGTIGGPVPSAALFNLSNLLSAVANWNDDLILSGIDSSLRGLSVAVSSGSAFELFSNGTISPLVVGPPASSFTPHDLTPSGIAIGDGQHVGTIGTSPALLLVNGSVEFLATFGGTPDIRTNDDGSGVNAGFVGEFYSVRFGGNSTINIDQSTGISPNADGKIQVSETALTVIERDRIGGSNGFSEFRIYYPSVNPAGLDRSVLLFDIFPELASIDFNRVPDISSVDGRLHMLLSGNDGLWLFTAPDPSIVPEPSAAVLIGALFLMAPQASRRNSREQPSWNDTNCA